MTFPTRPVAEKVLVGEALVAGSASVIAVLVKTVEAEEGARAPGLKEEREEEEEGRSLALGLTSSTDQSAAGTIVEVVAAVAVVLHYHHPCHTMGKVVLRPQRVTPEAVVLVVGLGAAIGKEFATGLVSGTERGRERGAEREIACSAGLHLDPLLALGATLIGLLAQQ